MLKDAVHNKLRDTQALGRSREGTACVVSSASYWPEDRAQQAEHGDEPTSRIFQFDI